MLMSHHNSKGSTCRWVADTVHADQIKPNLVFQCGGVAIVLVLLFLPNLPPAERTSTVREKWLGLDYLGALLSVAFVTTLLIPLQWGGNVKPWNDPAIIALFVVVRL